MAAIPSKLKAGDRVRFVSPASTPEREGIARRAEILESWGLKVDFGRHAFEKKAYLAGTDEERLADLNEAINDPEIRGIFSTRGGKGSYRIADRLDFDGVQKDPKFPIGFSDITMLHLSLYKRCGLIGLHGALAAEEDGNFSAENSEALRRALMQPGFAAVLSRPEEPTSALTTGGTANGRLIGGNLDMVAMAVGWALPDLRGAILLLEVVNMHIGQVDRQLTMLRKAGHLNGLGGVALGQFTGFDLKSDFSVINLLREHLDALDVPVLGGLPLGHGSRPLVVPIGTTARLDTAAGTLSFPD
ncbi:LD-carboxypeptidase [Neorhizobium sp. P12A]|uniref:S66 peptidase family protein n=1 Tax=Neorhizobium sp. P12A TaxID=2268027 RepID=UPI001FEE53B1|nr:LD-carboxypeptidase [Neorhizobium sp. P12A]